MPAFYKPERGVVTTSRKKPKPESWSTKKEKLSKKKPARSRHQSVAEDKRLSPTDKFKRDVLGQDMSDKYMVIDPKKKQKFQHGGRTNLLEELGRVEGEPSNRNRRAEVSRIHGELNRGYAKGGRAAFKHGKWVRDPNPHVDVDKYVDKQTGKEEVGKPGTRVKVPGSEMKFKKPGRSKGPSGRSALSASKAGGKPQKGWKLTTNPKTKSTLTGTDTTHGGGPDAGNIGYNKDLIYKHTKHRKKFREEMEKRKKRPERTMTPYRAKKAGGGVIPKIIRKLKPKEVDVDKVLKNLGDEIKAAPLPPKLKKLLPKLRKAFPHRRAGPKAGKPKTPDYKSPSRPGGKGKESPDKRPKKKYMTPLRKGGRIGLKHGSSAQQHYLQHGYGPTKTKLRTGKPKIAIKGWS